ncbi:MAG: hypothetical protein IJH40_11835 [Ruminococcus sp.]|uniref:hypothetical protein n=1 Tax=Ruminococcus sp. TaxID=41978 RepID=UPI0028732921|nr:hypothetical protein [Ruminococcus sp.]MBQ3286308.1 hypothetical protein [Ruminococcus sp.]
MEIYREYRTYFDEFEGEERHSIEITTDNEDLYKNLIIHIEGVIEASDIEKHTRVERDEDNGTDNDQG